MNPSKAAIAETKVAAVNTGTNFRYETASNRAGEYTLANLPPGIYRYRSGKAGMQEARWISAGPDRPDPTLTTVG